MLSTASTPQRNSQPETSPSTATAAALPKGMCRVGLYNQGATCYLNSLLQLLFHTTYFRSAVYQMSTGSDDLSQIPKALQLLFFQMQERDTAIETKCLTDTFGWDSGDVMVQQDIHEMITLLRENLENKMKGTRAEGAINRLFTGVSEKYFRCLDDSYTARTRETFYDIQLQVQGFSDLMSSLKSLLTIEQLTGSNKYKVEEEGKPPVYKDAETGMRFLKFPSVILCHLKRIEIDLESPNLEQKKINTPFQYPDELDLQPYEVGLPADANSNNVGIGDPSPAVYDLYGVIVHRGGVRSGHYFCYLRQWFENRWGDWVEYDDDNVRVVDHYTAVTKNFGEAISRVNAHGYHVQSYSAQNAYILAYVRRGDVSKVIYEECTDNIPPGVIEEFKAVVLQEAQARKEAELAARRCFVGFFTDDTIARHVREHKVDIGVGREPVPQEEFLKTDTVASLLARAAQIVQQPITNVRLWLCENRGLQHYSLGWRLVPTHPLCRGQAANGTTIEEEIISKWRTAPPVGAWNLGLYVDVAKEHDPQPTANAALFGEYQASSTYSEENLSLGAGVKDVRPHRFTPNDSRPTFRICLPKVFTLRAVSFRVAIPPKSNNVSRMSIRVTLYNTSTNATDQFTRQIELSPQRIWEGILFEPAGTLADRVDIQRTEVDYLYQYSTPDTLLLTHIQVIVPESELVGYLAPRKLDLPVVRSGAVCVQVKFFNHEVDALVYVGTAVLSGVETFRMSLPLLTSMIGGMTNISVFEERSRTEVIEVNLDEFPSDQMIRTGSILILQQVPETIALCYRHQRVDAYLRTLADTHNMNVRSILEPEKIVAVVPMQLQWQYTQVVDAIGRALELDPDYLRFYCSTSYRTPKPREEPERSDTVDQLCNMIMVHQWESLDLWYELLDVPREELESFTAGQVTIADARGNPVDGCVDVPFRLPNSATAREVVSAIFELCQRPWIGTVALLTIIEKCIRNYIVVDPQTDDADGGSVHSTFRQRTGRSFEIRPFVPPGPDELTFSIAIGQHFSTPLLHGTPFLLNMPREVTPSQATEILLEVTGTQRDELGEKYPVMMLTTAPLYFPDDSPLHVFWESTQGGSTASLMLNKKRPKEKPGSRYVSYNDVALTLEKKKGNTPQGQRKSGSASETP